MDSVKILFCYDKDKNEVFYRDAIKGEKYTCIDCGSELTCRDGEVMQKHLAHKVSSNCQGNGESIIHKHWKTNLFKQGMHIDISNKYKNESPYNVEITKVLNEVSLRKGTIKIGIEIS